MSRLLISGLTTEQEIIGLIILFIFIIICVMISRSNKSISDIFFDIIALILLPFFVLAIIFGLYKPKKKEPTKLNMTEEEIEQLKRDLNARILRDNDEKARQKRIDGDRLPYDYALITRAEMLIQIVKEAGLTGYLGRSVGDIKLYMSLVTRRLEHKKLVSECDYLEELLITDYRLAIMNTPTGYKLLMIHNK